MAAWRKKLEDDESKDVTFNRQTVGKVKKVKGKNEFELYDVDGNKIATLKGVSEDQATAALRRRAERDLKRQRGGGYKGQEQNPRPEGQGRSRGARKRAAKKPGSGKNPHLRKDVNKKDE